MFYLQLFRQSNPPGPVTKRLKYFQFVKDFAYSYSNFKVVNTDFLGERYSGESKSNNFLDFFKYQIMAFISRTVT